MSTRSRGMLKFTLTAFLAYAVLLEALAVLGVVGSQIRAHARNLDVAWAAGFAVFVVGPLLITLAVPAVLLTAALVWRRRHTTGAIRVLAETCCITLIVWAAWGTVLGLALVLLGVASVEASVTGTVNALALAPVILAPACAATWLLHVGKLDSDPAPAWS